MEAVINRGYYINQRIRERTQARNQADYANLYLFNKQLTNRSIKFRTYITLTHLATVHGIETWWLTMADKNDPSSLERRILRKIFGPVQDRGEWRICCNTALNELIAEHGIVRFMKSQRIK